MEEVLKNCTAVQFSTVHEWVGHDRTVRYSAAQCKKNTVQCLGT